MRDATPPAETLTATDAARMLGVSDTAVRKRIASGSLRAVKVGRQWQIPASEVTRLTEPAEPDRTNPNPQSSVSSDAETARIRAESAALRRELNALTEHAFAAAKHLERALDTIDALTEQVNRLTVLLANEQARRLRALPRPLSWLARLFGRR